MDQPLGTSFQESPEDHLVQHTEAHLERRVGVMLVIKPTKPLGFKKRSWGSALAEGRLVVRI